jgi:putative transferase (TIGR04331 family)
MLNQKIMQKIANANIRGTALKDFWGSSFNESIYLWEGAKHTIPIERWESDKTPVFHDHFSEKENIFKALSDCQDFFEEFIPIISNCLNQIHEVNFSTSFWRITLGYGLYQYICIVYDKYTALSNLDLNLTDIRLLKQDFFYIPEDYVDLHACFHSDFGVHQIVSHYYYLFAEKQFPTLAKNYSYAKIIQSNYINYKEAKSPLEIIIYNQKLFLMQFYQKNIAYRNSPKIALLEAYYHPDFIKKIRINSDGKVAPICLPVGLPTKKNINFKKRNLLTNLATQNCKFGSFEHFFFETLCYALPKTILENFHPNYNLFLKDINSQNFTHIVSEGWIGKFKTAIYVATAHQQGIKLIVPEHGAFNVLFKGNLNWFYQLTADTFLTTGWMPKQNLDVSKFKAGGFASRKIKVYRNNRQKDILYVTSSNPPYQGVYGREALFNTFGVRSLKTTLEFMDMLPKHLKDNFVLRLRRYPSAWDTANAWQVEQKGIKLDSLEQSLQNSISKSKIVVIDHLSTSFAEILNMNAPFILIHDDNIKCICEEYISLLESLKDVGILHSCGQSAALYLSQIYEQVETWWFNQNLQKKLRNFKDAFIQNESKVSEYLLSLIE